jgi:hypothetical protein
MPLNACTGAEGPAPVFMRFAGLALPAAGTAAMAMAHESLAACCGVSRPRLARERKQRVDVGQLPLRQETVEIVGGGWLSGHGPDSASWTGVGRIARRAEPGSATLCSCGD